MKTPAPRGAGVAGEESGYTKYCPRTISASPLPSQPTRRILVLDDLVESYGFLTDDAPAQAWLHDRGVSHLTRLMWPGPIGCARIKTHDGGLFEFDEDGERVFVMPVTEDGPYGDVIDVLAFRPCDPNTFWLHQGIATILAGEIEAEGPVRIFSTPLDWLAANGAGLVILDWTGASNLLRFLAEDGPGVILDDYDNALAVERFLIGPPSPRPKIYLDKDLAA